MSTQPGWLARHPWLTAAAVVLLLAWIVGAVTEGSNDNTAGSRDDPGLVAPQDEAEPAGEEEADESPTAEETAQPDAQPESRSEPRHYLVTRIVDGDTLELGNGETVRLVGIDAPEGGACGAIKATDTLAVLVLGKAVLLGESDEDRDGYGRLLRYVDIGNQDAGLRLIKNGLAIARYDSRDGYGRHPREQLYVAADKAAKQFICPKPQPLVPQQPSGDCGGYSPCIPAYPPDLDCADVNGPIYVSGPDPHGLDADDDGVACES